MLNDENASWRRQIEEQGYVVVKGIVDRTATSRVVADIFAHLRADPDDLESWYKQELINGDGMVEMYHYQSMWDNRQNPSVHAVFADIFGTDRLWVSIDRTNLKPPADVRYPHFSQPGFIHWDTDIANYPEIPFGVQGVLALTDTDETMGGFQCMPDLYRNLGKWIEERRRTGKPIERRVDPDDEPYPIVKVPLQAGDMVIWSTLLPHGNGKNISRRPRLAQFISMYPAGNDEIRRRARVEAWQTFSPLNRSVFPGDPRGIERALNQRIILTALGRKLLGVDTWD